MFPNNAVEYFVSYYDYYQPEAYIVSSDTYIEKDSSINDEIDRLRHSATAALSERQRCDHRRERFSCIYGPWASPEEYQGLIISLRPGMTKDRDELLRRLIDIQYDTKRRRARTRRLFAHEGTSSRFFPSASSGTAPSVSSFSATRSTASARSIL